MTDRYIRKPLTKSNIISIGNLVDTIYQDLVALESIHSPLINQRELLEDIMDLNKVCELLHLLIFYMTELKELQKEIENLAVHAFQIEEKYAPIVNKIWQQYLTSVRSFQSDHYRLLVSMIYGYTAEVKDQLLQDPKNLFLSTSLISEQHLRVFGGHYTHVGLLYEVNELNFLGSSEEDSQVYHCNELFGFESQENSLPDMTTLKNYDYRSINSLNDQSFPTKIKLPQTVLKSSKNKETYNEVVLLKKYSKLKGIIQFYYIEPWISKDRDQARFFSEKYKVPIIQINRIQQQEDLEKYKFFIIELLQHEYQWTRSTAEFFLDKVTKNKYPQQECADHIKRKKM